MVGHNKKEIATASESERVLYRLEQTYDKENVKGNRKSKIDQKLIRHGIKEANFGNRDASGNDNRSKTFMKYLRLKKPRAAIPRKEDKFSVCITPM